MGNANGIITAPVNTDDVSSVLGENSHDVKTLCMSSKIRMWARFKPEVINTPESISLVQRQSNNFGLSPSNIYSSKKAFIDAVKAGTFTGGWQYTRVSGNAWARLDDFDGYNHNATSPFGAVHPGTFMLTNNTGVKLTIPADSPMDDDTNISISEFSKGGADYKNWYFGILLFHTSRQFIMTTTEKIGTKQDWQVTFGWINPSYAGTYKAIPFLSSQPFTESNNDPSSVTIIGAGSAGVEVKLTTTSQTYVPFANCLYKNSTTTAISYTVTIQNLSSQPVTLTNVVLLVAKTEQDGISGNSQTLVSFGTITVGANQTWIREGSVNIGHREFQFCQLRYNGSTNTGWVNFEDIDTDAE